MLKLQNKQKESIRLHTSQEIAQGISPTQSAINAVQTEMIAQKTNNTRGEKSRI